MLLAILRAVLVTLAAVVAFGGTDKRCLCARGGGVRCAVGQLVRCSPPPAVAQALVTEGRISDTDSKAEQATLYMDSRPVFKKALSTAGDPLDTMARLVPGTCIGDVSKGNVNT